MPSPTIDRRFVLHEQDEGWYIRDTANGARVPREVLLGGPFITYKPLAEEMASTLNSMAAELAARDEHVLDLEAQLRDARGEADALRVGLSELAHEAREFTTAAEYKVEISYEEDLLAAIDHATKLLMLKGDGEGRFELIERSFPGLVGVARRMLDETYPPDVFVGGGPDTDPGVAFVVKLREALASVEGGGEHGA